MNTPDTLVLDEGGTMSEADWKRLSEILAKHPLPDFAIFRGSIEGGDPYASFRDEHKRIALFTEAAANCGMTYSVR